MKILSILLLTSNLLFSYEKIDLKSYKEDSSFENAVSLATGRENIYILTPNKVNIYSSDTLKYLNSFNITLKKPVALTVDEKYIYLIDAYTSSIYIFDKEGILVSNFGTKGKENGQLSQPSDIAIYADKILVADKLNNSINIYEKNGIFRYSFKTISKDGLKKYSPTRLSISPDGNIYVGEESNNVILKYDIKGNLIGQYNIKDYLFTISTNGFIYTANEDCKIREYDLEFNQKGIFGAKGRNKYEFQKIADIKLYGQTIYILDTKNKKVISIDIINKSANIKFELKTLDNIKLSLNEIIPIQALTFNLIGNDILYFAKSKNQTGVFLYKDKQNTEISTIGDREENIKNIVDIGILNNNIYLLDNSIYKVKTFEGNKYLFSFGDKYGLFGKEKDGKFSNPIKIKTTSDNNIYVLDSKFKILQVFNKDGIFLYSTSINTDVEDEYNDIIVKEDLNIYVLSSNKKMIYEISKEGKLINKFELKNSIRPVSFDYDNKNYLYVVDAQLSSVLIYNKKGDFITSFFGKGTSNTEFINPNILRYANNRLYISDTKLNKISVFNILYIPEFENFKISYSSTTNTALLSFKIKNDEYIKKINILKSIDNINFQPIKSSSNNEFKDTDITDGNTYYYKIEAISITDNKNLSETKSIYIEKIIKKEPLEQQTPSLNKPPLEITPVDLKYIFSSNYKYYLENPIGKITIKNNTKDKFENLKVSFFIKEYMDFPYDTIVNEIEPNSQTEVNLKATLNNKIININETTPIQTMITIKYYVKGEEREQNITLPIKILSKDSIIWNDTRRIANFITVKDPVIEQIAKNLLSKRDEFKYDIDANIISLAIISNYISSLGIKYLEDPVTPYKLSKSTISANIDTVNYPRNLLKIKTGDCDDLTALFASLLETIGIKTIIVDYPQHITLMIETKSDNIEDIGVWEEMLIKYNNRYYIPFEVTMFSKPLYENIKYAKEYYQENIKDVKLYNVRDALTIYEPPTFTTEEIATVEMTNELKERITNDLDGFSKENFSKYEKYYKNILEQEPQDTKTMLDLGILYANNNQLDNAAEMFNKVNEINPNDPSALNNLGNIHYLKGNYKKAIDYYNKAYALDPYDENILINISKSYAKNGMIDDAKLFFDKALKINPELKKFEEDVLKP